MRRAAWYFDFISPFSYLQIEQFGRLPADLEVELVPIVFAGLLTHHGHKGPAEIAAKRRFTYRFVAWQAQQAGIPFRFPPAHPFNPIRLLRLALVCGPTLAAARTIFRHVWREGHAPEDDQAFAALARALGVEDVEARINAQTTKDRLRANGERAIAAGIFGVPSFVVDGEIFWGADATGFLLDYLGTSGLFSAAEMQRIAELPTGSVRKS